MSESCTISIGEDGCARLGGTLTFESVPGLFKQAQELFHGSTPVSSLDLEQVTSADSAGLALLLEWQATRGPSQQALQIRNAPSGLLSLARLCEADQLLDLSGREVEE